MITRIHPWSLGLTPKKSLSRWGFFFAASHRVTVAYQASALITAGMPVVILESDLFRTDWHFGWFLLHKLFI
jgi:hypothetical protein